MRAAHPRSRGENSAWMIRHACAAGSSPLTRGKPPRHPALPTDHGLIPAHAGKTRRSLSTARTARGSSPLTRGKQGRRGRGPHPLGLIPAHAGKTYANASMSGMIRAHPRSRGENLVRHVEPVRRLGSSPLTRGKQPREHGAASRLGLIPAHAGKTGTTPTTGPAAWAHPRSRGENVVAASQELLLDGSSPLTRGKRRDPARSRPDQRLIPAHAGKTGPPGSR